ncbi:MAG: PH domain-containing protein [Candidatus Aenigmarchaeota archaeon]|nr:PH domain-containing protein [Candidatus Aenigmarchaeota archaeon]
MENEHKELVLTTSRFYFLGNYFIALLTIIFLVLAYTSFNFTFTLTPKNQSELVSTLVVLGIAAIAVVMVEQPEWEKFRTKFFVTMNEVVKEEGIIQKERVVLPYATVADIRAQMGFMGRLLNYGTVSVSSFKPGSDMVMKGVRRPEKVHIMIQNRVNMLREGQLQMFGKREGGKGEQADEKIYELENKRSELEEMIEKTKESFYNREIDEGQFNSTVEKFQQQIIEIDVKLKKLGKK